MSEVRVLFVCLGNICRSPTAHGVFQHAVEQAGLSHLIQVDSAGTSNWHVGSPPDSRSMAEARKRGYDLSSLRARQAIARDFNEFDYILAMDEYNLADLEQLRPADFTGHLSLFLDFSRQKHYREMPDPYHGGAAGFTLVLGLVEDASAGLLEHIRRRHL